VLTLFFADGDEVLVASNRLVAVVAEEQGSDSAAVVWTNYHSEAERRDRRRRAMREKLAGAFEADR
jgi:hypothetical protein